MINDNEILRRLLEVNFLLILLITGIITLISIIYIILNDKHGL